MKVDASSLGYKFFSHVSRKDYRSTWLGTVEADTGERGALGLNPMTGGYLMYRHGCEPVELDTMQVLAALAEPVRLNPPGRKPSDVSDYLRLRMCTVNLSDQVREAAKIMGNGNMSLGVRLAVEFAATREDEFKAWR